VLAGAGITRVGSNPGVKSAAPTPAVATVAAGNLKKVAGSSTVTATLTKHGLTNGAIYGISIGAADAASFTTGYYVMTSVDANTFTYDDGLVVGAAATSTAAAVLNGDLVQQANSATVTAHIKAHGFTNGQMVYVAGAPLDTGDAGFPAGFFTVAYVDANTFTYTNSVTPVALTINTTAVSIVPVVELGTRTITGFDKVSGRPMTLGLTLSDGAFVEANPNYVWAGSTPVLFTVDGTKPTGQKRVYDKFMKALYNYWLISYDLSSGVHNPSFVKAMLQSMVDNLAVP
jgi:hypothetical protein